MPDSSPLQPCQRFGNGRFALVRALGRGGMGEVWLAQDERLEEAVALKFLPPEIRGDPAALDGLRRETARSHKLTHPNIVRIHDFHEEMDGTAFIVMEYVDGPTLASLRVRQEQGVLTWDYLRPLVEQLCAALDYAHGEKVIHRDLKPANMMVDSRGRLKLADFGIAAAASDSMSRVSAQGPTSGTLLYMSPQQLAGKRAQVTDDIYALGATLYELLTSQPPFYTGDLTHQVLHEPPEPIEDRLAALEIKNDVPPDVAALIMACLSKEPGQRPQSAAAVAGWIGLDVAQKPSTKSLTETVFSDTPEAESSGARSGRKWLWAAGVLAASLALGAGGWWYWTNHPREKTPVAKIIAPSPNIDSRSSVTSAATVQTLTSSSLKAEALWGRRFRFSWKTPKGAGVNGIATLNQDGTISGIKSPNETYWLIDGEGHLRFLNKNGKTSTLFATGEQRDGKWFFAGSFQFRSDVTHTLEELGPSQETAASPSPVDPDCFVVLDATNGFYASPGVPERAVAALKEARFDNAKLKSFAFTASGEWILITDQGYQTSSDNLPACQPIKKHNWSNMKSVAFAPSDTWIILFDDNGFWGPGNPVWVEVNKLKHSGHNIQNVAWGTGCWVVTYDKNLHSDNRIPAKLVDALNDAAGNDAVIQCIAFSGRDWICLAQDRSWTSNPNLPASRIVDQDFKQGVRPTWIAFVPRKLR